MIKGVIFDLDGVLEDSNKSWISLYRDISHKVGISGKLSDDEITKDFGEKYEVVLEGLVGKEKLSQALQMLRHTLESDAWTRDIKLTPHSLKVLDNLEKRGTRLAVVSGNTSKILERAIKTLGIGNYFHSIVSSDDVGKAKPDPEGILKALSSLGIPKSEAVYVGDAANDVMAARRAGVRVAVVLTGALNRGKAEEIRPDWILQDLQGLLKIVQ